MKHSRAFAFLILCTTCVAAPAVAEDDIKWSITPYIWAVETKVDLSASGTPIGGATVSFKDLLDVTDAAFQIHVERGLRGNWSASMDLTYMDTSDTDDAGPIRIKTDSTQWFIDAVMAYWPNGQAGGLSLFGGLRYSSLDDEYKFSLPATGTPVGSLKNDRSFTDLLLGSRYRYKFNESWAFVTLADYAFGDSEGIFQVQALARYAVGRNRQNGILFGYRYKDAEYEAGIITEDYQFSGPIVGFNFRF